jgi:hypothetical protein
MTRMITLGEINEELSQGLRVSNVVPLRPGYSGLRNVLRGAERDAAVLAAADWYRQNAGAGLSAIADRFNLSLTAAGEAILLSESDPR